MAAVVRGPANVVSMGFIEVIAAGEDSFSVSVRDDRGSTEHEVTGVTAAADRHGVAPETLVEASFRFLLDREPKESILARFELDVIARYFPEYPTTISSYLDAGR